MTLPAALWDERSPRERWMIGALAVLIGALVYWYGLWAPLGSWRNAAAVRLESAQRVTVEAERVRADLAKLDKVSPLESEVVASAGEAGVRVGKMEASGDVGVTIHLEGTDPTKFLAWTRRLAEHKAIAVTNLTATAAGDGTIDVEAVLSRPGG